MDNGKILGYPLVISQNYGNSPCLTGKSSINWARSIAMLVYWWVITDTCIMGITHSLFHHLIGQLIPYHHPSLCSYNLNIIPFFILLLTL